MFKTARHRTTHGNVSCCRSWPQISL